jgi:hypothetical protein
MNAGSLTASITKEVSNVDSGSYAHSVAWMLEDTKRIITTESNAFWEMEVGLLQ